MPTRSTRAGLSTTSRYRAWTLARAYIKTLVLSPVATTRAALRFASPDNHANPIPFENLSLLPSMTDKNQDPKRAMPILTVDGEEADLDTAIKEYVPFA